MKLSVTLDTKKALAKLGIARNRLRNLTPVLKEIGEAHLRTVDNRFRREQGTHGQFWKPPKPRHILWKRKKRYIDKTLQMSGLLRAGINYRASRNSVTISSDKAYAATHEFGDPRRNIPARPFLGVSQADAKKYKKMILDHFGGSSKG
jgi:phage virion morphogenesis protein